jgi:hypothetical protein
MSKTRNVPPQKAPNPLPERIFNSLLHKTVLCRGAASAAAEKLFSKGVILSGAKDLLFPRAESKANPSDAHPNMRNYGACREPRKIGATSG